MNTSTNMDRVYIVEDDEVASHFIQKTLASAGYMIEVFPSAEAFLQRELPNEPACLLVDVVLPDTSGIELARELLRRQTPYAIVFMSGQGDIATSVEAMKLGAIDFLQKPCGVQMLSETVALALSKSKTSWQIHQEEQTVFAAVDSLTPREKEILQGIAEGMLSKAIAKKLGISHRTVDVHRSHIMEKLRVESPTQLAHIMYIMQRRRTRLASQNPQVKVTASDDLP